MVTFSVINRKRHAINDKYVIINETQNFKIKAQTAMLIKVKHKLLCSYATHILGFTSST